MKLTLNSLKYLWFLVKTCFKSHFNKLLLAFMLFAAITDFTTEKDLTGGITFVVFILFGYLLNTVYLRIKLKENENKKANR